ncbi:MAG: ribose 5-phosphate isomerase B [Coriobacteriaceae bacterium]|nr:ribose 5-phosphate isomerase B [Coriobacteriaceae bacterium]
MRIAIASDHGGFETKQKLLLVLDELGCTYHDFGCDSEESVDYPDYAVLVAEAVVADEADFGVLVCGTGIGMAIAANKVHGIRAANVTSPDFARLARQHNNANVLTLSGRFVDFDTNRQILEVFLKTEFEGGRHKRRVDKIRSLE